MPAGLDEAMVRTVVDGFYDAVRRDPLLAPVFDARVEDGEWPHHLGQMYDFWSSMLLGTRRYSGRPLPKHLAIAELSDAHFTRWLALFRRTVETLCTPEIAALFIDRAERIAHSFRLAMAFHRNEDTTRISFMHALSATKPLD